MSAFTLVRRMVKRSRFELLSAYYITLMLFMLMSFFVFTTEQWHTETNAKDGHPTNRTFDNFGDSLWFSIVTVCLPKSKKIPKLRFWLLATVIWCQGVGYPNWWSAYSLILAFQCSVLPVVYSEWACLWCCPMKDNNDNKAKQGIWRHDSSKVGYAFTSSPNMKASCALEFIANFVPGFNAWKKESDVSGRLYG